MFNDDNTEAQVLSMEDILGAALDDVEVFESRLLPQGPYVFRLHDFAWATYEIKSEDHPMAGQDAARLELQFNIEAIDDTGKVKYAYKDQFEKYAMKVMPTDQVAEKFVDTEFKHSIMFGNDTVIDDKTGKPKRTGLRQLKTLLAAFIGEARAAEKGLDLNTATPAQLLEAAKGLAAVVPIVNEKRYNSDAVDANLHLIGKFYPVD